MEINDFEWDDAKDLVNQAKHGISFLEATELWDDPNRLVFPAVSANEPRYSATGLIHGRYWTAIFTLRNNRVRIISVRRARIDEVKRNDRS